MRIRTAGRAALAVALIWAALAPAIGWAAPAAKTSASPAATRAASAGPRTAPAKAVKSVLRDGEAEARLIEVYRLVGQGNARIALVRAQALVKDHPNFQLAQLVYGDLLAARVRPLRAMGDVPDTAATSGGSALAELREESALRIRALRERPAPGTVPAQFVQLSPQNRHAIAIDTSRARLYLFENSAAGTRLLADYYISVGKLGTEKVAEGDLRTPLGIYFVTSNLNPKSLKDFYGSGALPINYPNPYDARRGKTGSGIWLHGSPPAQFSRAPKATDGCVVLANPDLLRIVKTVQVRSTPVVIAQTLSWVSQAAQPGNAHGFAEALAAWRVAKSSGDAARVLDYYTSDFSSYGKTLTDWTPALRGEVARARGRDVQLKDLSYLRWTDSAETMVVTFGEVLKGARTGPVKRQYWVRSGLQWKIFFEGVIG